MTDEAPAPQAFLDGKVVLHGGDSRDLVKGLSPGLLDAVVCDPPYALVSIVKRFGKAGAAPANGDVYKRASAGFMGKQWDTGEVAFDPAFWADVWAACKPGAHLVAFSGTRSYHRLACAIEDAGFEIRDQLAWVYGSGFPKSHDVAKAIDKRLGAKGSFGAPKSEAHAGWIERGRMRGEDGHEGYQRPWMQDEAAVGNAARQYLPGSEEAAAWQGWGTALKPAWEPIVLARKALDGTVGGNVLSHGVGALNIDGCRVGDEVRVNASASSNEIYGQFQGDETDGRAAIGRWPANIVHDGSDEVLARFPETVSGSGERSGVMRTGLRGLSAPGVAWCSILLRGQARPARRPGARAAEPSCSSARRNIARISRGAWSWRWRRCGCARWPPDRGARARSLRTMADCSGLARSPAEF